jgi:hypothetical protein
MALINTEGPRAIDAFEPNLTVGGKKLDAARRSPLRSKARLAFGHCDHYNVTIVFRRWS